MGRRSRRGGGNEDAERGAAAGIDAEPQLPVSAVELLVQLGVQPATQPTAGVAQRLAQLVREALVPPKPRRKTRPTKAGLKIFLPRPPKDILPTPMETIAPIRMIHQGKLLGTLNASKIPVIIADPSVMVTAVLKIYFWITNSTRRHITTDINVTRTASRPKK